jgi:hypothetical protein
MGVTSSKAPEAESAPKVPVIEHLYASRYDT